MPKKDYPQPLELMIVFVSFVFSNISAIVGVYWLVPPLVLGIAIIWIIFAVISVWMLRKYNILSLPLKNLKKNWIIFPFLVFAGCSIFWSVHWEISFYRWLTLLTTIVTGAFIGLRYGLKELLKLLSIFGLFILFLNTILVYLMPSIGIMDYYIIQGAWRGLYWHKNHMGFIVTFINLLFLINLIDAYKSKGQLKYIWGLLYLFTLFFLYQTDSVGAYLSTIFVHGVILLGLIWLKFRCKFRRVHVIIVGVLLIIAAIIIFTNTDLIFGMFNRSSSLTGRIPMWSHLFNFYFSKKPLTGYGFNAFWYIPSHRINMQQAAGYPDQIIIADNGFIDILVNTGYIGFILFSVFYVGLWWRSIKYAVKASDIIGLFPIALMAYTLIANVSWSLIFENEGFFMLIMISVMFCLSKGEGSSKPVKRSNDLQN